MSQAVFPGAFDARAAFVPDDAPRFLAFRRKLAGKRAEVVLRKPRSKRSLDMNAYLHRWPFKLMAEHFGEDLAGIKYALAGECFGWRFCAMAKREVPIKPHSSDWSVEDSTYFVEWVIPWAAQNHGVSIPYPRECM